VFASGISFVTRKQNKHIMKKLVVITLSLSASLMACNSSSDKKTDADTITSEQKNQHSDITSISPGSQDLNEIDREFVLKAGMGNTAEVKAGAIAESKGLDAEVKEFGKMMIKDHGEAQANLKIAAANVASVPDSMDAAHKELGKKLESIKGKDFDKEYISAQVKDHLETIALFEKEIMSGSHSALKQFASNTLPHLKMHLEKAQALQNKLD
jgi:putative membrane protein